MAKRAPKNTPTMPNLFGFAPATEATAAAIVAQPTAPTDNDRFTIDAARMRLTHLGAPPLDDCGAFVDGDTVRFFREQRCVATLTYNGKGHVGSWSNSDKPGGGWKTVEHTFHTKAEAEAPTEQTTDTTSDDDRYWINMARATLTSVGAVSMHQYVGWISGDRVIFGREEGGAVLAWLSYDGEGAARGEWITFTPVLSGESSAETHSWTRPGLGVSPVAEFTSPKGRRFTVGLSTHKRRNFTDDCGVDTFPILFDGQPAGSMFRGNDYGKTSAGELRWHASMNPLRWKPLVELPRGQGYDVAAFDTAAECLDAWARSADQIIDAQEARAQQEQAEAPAPVCPRCLGVEPGKSCGTPNDPHTGPFTADLCAPCESATSKMSVAASFARLSDKSESTRFTVDLARMTLLKLGAEIVNGCVGWVDGPTVCFAEQQHGTRLASVTYDDTGSWKASWIVRLPNGSIRNDTAEHKQEHPARKPDPSPSAPLPARTSKTDLDEKLEDPLTIAKLIVADLDAAGREMKHLLAELGNGSGKASHTVSLVLIKGGAAFLVADNGTASPVNAVAVLDAFRARHPVSYSELYDLALEMGSPPVEDTSDLGTRIAKAMGKSIDRGDEELRRLEKLHAEILGCSVEELAEKRKAEEAEKQAEASKKRAARAVVNANAKTKPVKAASKDASIAERATTESTRQLTDRQRELLGVMVVDGCAAIYPNDAHLPDWKALKVVMEMLGGVYRSKTKSRPCAFVFEDDVDVVEVMSAARDSGIAYDPKLLPRACGFVPTPAPLADLLVDWVDPQPGDTILEPEAGSGRIVEAIWRAETKAHVACYELLETNREKLVELGEDHCGSDDGDLKILGDDFLQADPDKSTVYDGVCQNPPFEKGADIAHVRHAIRFVKTGKRLAAIVSAGAMFRSDKAAVEFRAFVEQHGTIEALPDGSFTEEGTGVRTAIVRLTACPSCSLAPANHARPLF